MIVVGGFVYHIPHFLKTLRQLPCYVPVQLVIDPWDCPVSRTDRIWVLPDLGLPVTWF